MKRLRPSFALVTVALAACGSDGSFGDGAGGAAAGAPSVGVPGSGGAGNAGTGVGGAPSPTGGATTSGGKTSSGGTAGRAFGGMGSGGAGGRGGAAGASGSAGKGASGGSGGVAGGTSTCSPWPASQGNQNVPSTIKVSASQPYDGGFKLFVGSGALGGGGQNEDQPPLFELANGATLRNVIIGAPAADGIHCEGSCTLQNVWWVDVGEDAATLQGSSSSQVMTIDCGGAKKAADKIFQHNGAGKMIIRNFTADDFGKLYRSCGNCGDQYARHVELVNVTARAGNALVGLNENYGDTAKFTNVSVAGGITVCERYRGNDTGAEPTQIGEGPDSEHCLYQASSIGRL